LAAFSAAIRKSPHTQDCVVAQAVAFEPVSVREFPANREKNREFSRTAGSSEQEAPNGGVTAGFRMQIPY
jgi:hypothetical protein